MEESYPISIYPLPPIRLMRVLSSSRVMDDLGQVWERCRGVNAKCARCHQPTIPAEQVRKQRQTGLVLHERCWQDALAESGGPGDAPPAA